MRSNTRNGNKTSDQETMKNLCKYKSDTKEQ